MIHVLVYAPFSMTLMDKFRAVSPELEIEQEEQPERRWPDNRITQAEIVFAISAIPNPEQAPNLRWLQTHWAGVEHLRAEAIWKSDITITTTSGIHAPNIGQYVMTQILTWANRVPRWFHYQRNSDWPEDRWAKFLPDELRGRTLGILGYGSIGREIARLAKGFGMTVLATKRDARRIEDSGYTLPGTGDPDGSMVDRIYPGEATRMMVGECDYVVITLPETPGTHHIVDESILRGMKTDCFLVNVGRGSVINEDDLVQALKKGWIAGAGLDVFESEPLSPESPLWSMQNVILTPHISGFTPHYDARAADVFEENLRRYVTKEPLLNVVDRGAGY
jgi:phosphoglycerate dehydrogenase-like enzyme